jgi:hypothetical protein
MQGHDATTKQQHKAIAQGNNVPLRRLTNYLLRLLNNMSHEHFEDLNDFFWSLVTDNDFGQMDNELEATEHMKLVFFKLFACCLTDGNEGNGICTSKRPCNLNRALNSNIEFKASMVNRMKQQSP